jgi:hypothetical protein
MSALAALKLLTRTDRKRAFGSVVVPLFGAVALAAIIVVDVVQSDATTRAIEIGGLAFGLPFAWWRGRRFDDHLTRIETLGNQAAP